MRYMIRLLACLCLSTPTYADSPLFSDKTAVKAVLTAPMAKVIADKKKEVRPYEEAFFSYKLEDAEAVRVPLKVRTRGVFRRTQCSNPPLQLNFKKAENDGNLFASQDKLKLVAPCKRADFYNELVALEYVAYQIFELISDYHFKTRLLDLSYVDTNKKLDPWQVTAFIIEDIEQMAARYDMTEQKIVIAERTAVDHHQTALVELFQLFIGNTDYSTYASHAGGQCCHNVKMIAADGEGSQLIPVPYDFDASGWVNAKYASPAEQFPIKRTTQRFYTGFCKNEKYVRSAIQRFQKNRENIYSLIENSEMISDKNRKRKLSFTDRFYKMIDDEKEVQKKIFGRCRGDMIDA